MMTNQQVFDKVIPQWRARGYVRANDGGGSCMYRSPKGPCLVGMLISDEDYREAFDSCLTLAGVMRKAKIAADFDFLYELRELHDTTVYPETAPRRIERFAAHHGLTIPQ